MEETCKELKNLTTELSEIVKRYDDAFRIHSEKIRDNETETHQNEQRISAIEQRPAKRWEDLSGAILGAIGAGIGGSVLTLVVQALMQA